MLSSKKWLVLTLLLLAVACVQVAPRAIGSPSVKEEIMLSQILNANLQRLKVLYRYTHDMKVEAGRFQSPRHQARYRFAPSEHHGKALMSLARKMHMDFDLVRGILGFANVPNRDTLIKQIQDGSQALATYGRRALRARKDGNFALYLASAQAAEKELKSIDIALRDIEEAINASIRESDSRMEDL
ncbi:MAG: hypothetical protein OZSIB_3838 [Candidatus Ozemobacter sibiricus]|uniref:Uncharacterized protein n=1 Tax=Candidatus Ozemobacter sibiricus TaxID=2268124 RepID=A0A367ZQF2_9BACT|nr:MAG: hypothetical protein OZSIB_3838 [Candidatus Ozemobacter sibiricus]